MYFRLGKLRRVSTYVHMWWGIIGHVTVEAGNTVGTDGAPPQNLFLWLGILWLGILCVRKLVRSLLGSYLVNLLLGTLYQSINSVKHQQRRHLVFGVFTVIWSMWTGIHPARLRTLVVGRDIPCKSTLQAVEKILPTRQLCWRWRWIKPARLLCWWWTGMHSARSEIIVRGQSYGWRLEKYWPTNPSPPGECVPPAFGAGGGHTR